MKVRSPRQPECSTGPWEGTVWQQIVTQISRYLDIPDCGGAGVSLLLGRVPRPVVVRLRVAAEDQSEVSMWSRDPLSTNHSSPEEELWLGEDLLDSAHHRHLVIRRHRVGEERAGPGL